MMAALLVLQALGYVALFLGLAILLDRATR